MAEGSGLGVSSSAVKLSTKVMTDIIPTQYEKSLVENLDLVDSIQHPMETLQFEDDEVGSEINKGYCSCIIQGSRDTTAPLPLFFLLSGRWPRFFSSLAAGRPTTAHHSFSFSISSSDGSSTVAGAAGDGSNFRPTPPHRRGSPVRPSHSGTFPRLYLLGFRRQSIAPGGSSFQHLHLHFQPTSNRGVLRWKIGFTVVEASSNQQSELLSTSFEGSEPGLSCDDEDTGKEKI
ncbi:uncharacterized protein LOC122019343 [Zingiber officinale]|uniref:uncharacterized protein LOC122019343 n=1 Tax=Zingiber officinale TaxID=94328 RepID=UPI001C4B1E5F|nr:uncharacterized protein LOC122019343 [Zingiber officinale]